MRHPERIIKRKLRLIQSEFQMVNHYYAEITDLRNEYYIEYSCDLDFFLEKMGDKKLTNPNSEEESNSLGFTFSQQEKEMHDPVTQENGGISEAPEWAKKLFKKIALMTHPDRVKDKDLRGKLEKVFLRANAAVEQGNFDELLAIALELNLDTGLEDDRLISAIEKKIADLRTQIEIIENSIEWVWCEALGKIDLRKKLLVEILGQHGFSISEPIAVDMIKERHASG